MQDSTGRKVDIYIPRKCLATNHIIESKDHASVQINVGHLDANGSYTGEFTPFAFGGYVRRKGESDSWLNMFTREKKLLDMK